MIYARKAGDVSVAVWQDFRCLELMEMLQKVAFVTWLGWEEVHPAIHIDSDRSHIQMFKKMAEVIEFAEDNWTLIFSHSFSGWLGFLYYLPRENSPEHPFHTALRKKSFLMTKFDMWLSEKLQDMAEPQKSIFDFNMARSDI